MDITVVAKMKTNDGSEGILDLKEPVLVEMESAREFKVKNALEYLGHTDIKAQSLEMNKYVATSVFNGESYQTEISFSYALRANGQYFELQELKGMI
ncbi:hypothetical protein M2M59_14435 [Rummeliibacillus sp. G93]|uniref:hypothetical protein n=1 Tax=Rummeliibacillus TaxID=648802 RepID=UPI0011732587|nr:MULTISPECIES: hypothetical protein [Rummeliibacillus]MBB5171512.1 hypothetical protein [Rummeliibacillus stabekisii]MCM3317755.1 hypothetical protein [Rummeliibacillus stabekisii]UQW97096.1 hypothetical protein M2M59_14435 [Rummeliibacillus sp. G93]GEL05820.1 hypothetical protein RST01_24470 [Rummeliibacillus stabekisii]